MTQDGVTVEKNEAEQRFEVRLEETLSLLEYRREGDRIVYTHTEVPDALEGRGIGSRLARTALDYARAENLSVVPLCPFVSAYIKRHPEYLGIVDPGYRSRLG